jgi:hypothetical protein
MDYNDEQFRLISDAVKEQLGIEEDDDPLEEFELLNLKIKSLEEEIQKRDDYIHKLEVLLVDESKRLDLLEKMFYEFKYKR